jgi:hypothetical protein
MKRLSTACAATLALIACSPQRQADAGHANQSASATGAQRPSDADSEAYMRKAEEDWAALAVRKIPGLLDRILSDDYVGVSSKGDVRSKADQIRMDTGPGGEFKSSKLDYVHYRHFGDAVIAQGEESLQRKDGKPDLTLIWTDIWMFRDGKWQVVASQDSKLPEKK